MLSLIIHLILPDGNCPSENAKPSMALFILELSKNEVCMTKEFASSNQVMSTMMMLYRSFNTVWTELARIVPQSGHAAKSMKSLSY